MNIEKLSKHLSESAKEASNKIKEYGYGDLYDVQAALLLSQLYITEIGGHEGVYMFCCKKCGSEEFVTKSEYDKLKPNKLYCTNCMTVSPNPVDYKCVECAHCGDLVVTDKSEYNVDEKYYCFDCMKYDK